ncbi:acetyl-CoA hydrolase/transferase family protein [Cysteiniphilum halobium]|uniref:acetyl-CoA hydrolase/transferase family protein n=1 Tax=Cysteiniphilum halobium TaxID=2219059 RepID=UPI003F85AED4
MPPLVLSALSKQVHAKVIENINLYYVRSSPEWIQGCIDYDLLDQIHINLFFMNTLEREWLKKGKLEKKHIINFIPSFLSKIPTLFNERKIELDLYSTIVSPMDEFGYFSLGLNVVNSLAAIKNAKRVIVEVNNNMPRINGPALIHISQIDAIIENHKKLWEIDSNLVQPSKEDEKIVDYIAQHIEDGACLQIGRGYLPDLLCAKIKDRKHMGIHSEFLSDGLVKLIKCGAIDGSRKSINQYKHVFTISFGSSDLYKYVDNNQSIEGFPSDYINNPAIIAKNNHVISVNAAIEIDLFGQVNAEIVGNSQYSGVGGQIDFMRGAQMSKGGKSFIAIRSTAKDGTISKIVPKLESIVTDTRMDVDYVVTEYGCLNLRGLSTEQRMYSLIELAHPQFRDDLKQKAIRLLIEGKL